MSSMREPDEQPHFLEVLVLQQYLGLVDQADEALRRASLHVLARRQTRELVEHASAAFGVPYAALKAYRRGSPEWIDWGIREGLIGPAAARARAFEAQVQLLQAGLLSSRPMQPGVDWAAELKAMQAEHERVARAQASMRESDEAARKACPLTVEIPLPAPEITVSVGAGLTRKPGRE